MFWWLVSRFKRRIVGAVIHPTNETGGFRLFVFDNAGQGYFYGEVNGVGTWLKAPDLANSIDLNQLPQPNKVKQFPGA